MNVLFVCSGKDSGQPSALVQNQGISLSKKGINLTYFTICRKGLKGYLSEYRKLRKFLARHSFDLLHAHYGLAGILTRLASFKTKLVVSFMGDDLVGTNNRHGKIKSWSLLLVRINTCFARYSYDFSIVKSEEMMKKLIKNTPAMLIPNGVDMNYFQPMNKSESKLKLGIVINDKVILFIGDIGRAEKNYFLAKNAISIINDKTVNLMIINNIPNSELSMYYSAADTLILTSFHEGSPNVVKEAMSCCCPVVSTDVGDTKWLFGNTPGHYITSFDASDVANKIKLAIEYRKKYNLTPGRTRLIELGLDSTTAAERIISLYKSISN